MMFENQMEKRRNENEQEEIMTKLSALKKRKGGVMKSRKVVAIIDQLREKPKINEISRQIAERRNQKVPIQDRYMLELKRRERRLGKLKQQLEHEQKLEEEDLTFRPSINPKSRKMSKRRIEKCVGE